MKVLPIAIIELVLVWTVSPAFGGYGDLKRDLEEYSPPAIRQQVSPTNTVAKKYQDTFEASKNVIEETRDRWALMIENKFRPGIDADISSEIRDAATDNARTLALLEGRFSLGTLKALIQLRNPSIKGALARLKAASMAFSFAESMQIGKPVTSETFLTASGKKISSFTSAAPTLTSSI